MMPQYSTYMALILEFGTAHIPIELIGKKFFNLDSSMSKRYAARNQFPFPVFRTKGQKSVWMVDAKVFSDYLDEVKSKSSSEWKNCWGTSVK